MIIVTATTQPTIKYLSIYELENYKKQFQSFWIPFMEQFIPATTIWVAGERWCNEPCTIIDTCDYDFELVASASTIQQIRQPTKKYLLNSYGNSLGNINGNTTSVLPPAPFSGGAPQNTTDLTNITDLGQKIITENVLTQLDTNIDIVQYRDKFISLEPIVL
jgi:hypothetical protein